MSGHSRLGLLLTLVALLPSGQAWGPTEPILTDGTEDIDVNPGGYVSMAQPEIDIVSLWLEQTAVAVVVHWEILDIEHRTRDTAGATYGLAYQDDRSSFGYISATRHEESWSFEAFAVPRDGGPIESRIIQGRIVGGDLQVDMPQDMLDGPMREFQASTLLLVGSGGSYSGGGPVWFRDAAPNVGYGPHTLPALPPS